MVPEGGALLARVLGIGPTAGAPPDAKVTLSVPEIGQSLPTGQFGPPLRGGRDLPPRRRPWRRLVTLAVAFISVVALTGSVTAGALLWYGQQSIGQLDIPGLARPDGSAVANVEEMTEVLNVLLVGDDSREGLTDEQLLALGTDEVDGGRTDTIMLLQLDPVEGRALLLSFPRDLLVTRCDGSRGRINAAYSTGESTGTGGAVCVVETVSDLTGIPIHHYIEVNFAGFIDVVDTLGGVTMYIEEPGLRDRYAGLELEPGCQELDGAEALSFVRARKLDSDFGRMARQQRFVKELTDEVASAGTLLNVPRLFALVDAVGKAVDTDRDLSLADMRRIAFSLRDLSSGELDTRTVPATTRVINGASMQVMKEEEAEELFAAFREGEGAPDHLGREQPHEVTVADVSPVAVLNGAGVTGLAADAAELLEDRGFTVAGTENADDFDYDRTEIHHSPEAADEAKLLRQALPAAELVPGDDDEELTVIIGARFDPQEAEREAELDPVDPEETSAPAPETTPSPEPTYQGATAAEERC